MGVYTFICRNSNGEWNAKQYSGDLEGSAGTKYDLERRLVGVALAAEGSGPVRSSFSYVTPSSAVFQVIIGGGGGFIGGGAAAPAATGGAAAAPAEPPAEEKKEEKEESDEDMGFSLFD